MSFRIFFGLAGGILSAALVFASGIAGAQSRGGVQGGIDELAAQIVTRSVAADRTTIAISSFPHVDDSCSELSNFLVDELVLSFFNIPGNQLSIIERSQLDRIFAELELSLSGAVDVNTTQELGRIHGVDTLLVGTLSTIGDDLRVNARLIDTETAQVYSAAAVNIPRTSTLEELMARPAAGGCTMRPSGSRGNAGGRAIAPAWQRPGETLTGNGCQSGSCWSIEISFGVDGNGQINYPSIPCSGTLELLNSRDGVFRETITTNSSRCINGGTVTLTPIDDRRFNYEWSGGGIHATGIVASAP